MKYILTFDQGTTSSRTILFDTCGNIIALSQKEYTQIYPQPSWVEHDPFEILQTQISTAKETVAKSGIDVKDIACAAITNQRETTIVWDAQTGRPVYNAIVWQCRRTSDMCKALSNDPRAAKIHEKTGLNLDPYFSATKIKWILDNTPGAREKAEKGELLFGTVDTWLLWKLTGGKVHATDYTNASRTMLFNIGTLEWDNELLSLFDIPKSMLPKVLPSGSNFGVTKRDILGCEIPVCSVLGDQQSSLFGQTCFEKGEAKNTYGTGCFVLMNTGTAPANNSGNMLSTIAWGIGKDVRYACEGSVFTAGAVIQWLCDELELITSPAETVEAANAVSDNGGVYIVPAFTGLGAPYWNPYARGTIVGLTRGANRNHIIRAALEGIAYQSADVIREIEKVSGTSLEFLGADGGASANPFLMQFQADILGKKLLLPKCKESTALGTALMAGLVCGIYNDYGEIRAVKELSKTYSPSLTEDTRSSLLCGWERAVRTAVAYTEQNR